jgi:hypothetical protein
MTLQLLKFLCQDISKRMIELKLIWLFKRRLIVEAKRKQPKSRQKRRKRKSRRRLKRSQ